MDPTPIIPPNQAAQQLVLKARELLHKLRRHDAMANELVVSGAVVSRRERALQDAQQILQAHASVPFCGITRQNVIQELHHEDLIIRSLKQENAELSQAVQEHGDAINYIMRKYHQHSKTLEELNKKSDRCPLIAEKVYSIVIEESLAKLENIVDASVDYLVSKDRETGEREKTLSGLRMQNSMLRSALDIRTVSKGKIQQSGIEAPL